MLISTFSSQKLNLSLTLLIMSLTIIDFCHGCGQALDWEPLTPEERAARSPIVVVGYATKSYKPEALPPGTRYEVDFKIFRIIKGEEQFKHLPETNLTAEGIHRLSNFGNVIECLSHIDTERVYMVYLKVVNDHLSAYYSDIFGAVEIWTMEMEERVILTNLGYKPWSEWSGCSEQCGTGGYQKRVRECQETECKGHNVQKRKCNEIPCENVKDIVELAKFESMPKGVISLNVSGYMIYDLTPNFYGQLPAAELFNPLWPQEFSILARVRPRKTRYPREGQYLFSIADSSGRQYFGVKLFPAPTIEMLHSTGKTSTVAIPLPYKNINDGDWHQFGFGVNKTHITMYYNCIEHTMQTIELAAFIPNVYRSTLIIGTRMFSMDRGADERYEGALSQLIITDNPNDVSQQCSAKVWGETVQQMAASQPRDSDAVVSADLRPNYLDHWEWSTWSECSSSCSFGVKTRRPFCLDDSINSEDCVPYYVPKVHKKQCFAGVCPGCDCSNGGLCVEDGVCECPDGWTGDECQIAVCEKGCTNGDCVSPGVCECKEGWTGVSCSLPLCFPLCRNGGVCTGYNQCTCPEGFGGRFCEEFLNIVKCDRECKNGGTCVGYNKCECPEGWRGARCHKPKPLCEDGCMNGGRCVKGNMCKCRRGFTGPTCSSDVCGNCRNGGICNRRTKQCDCPTQYTGSICQYEVKDEHCIKDPCQNIGKCIGYNKCYCPDGWYGLKCEYRQCSRYKVKITYEKERIRTLNYKLVPCEDNPHGRCRVPNGFKYEMQPRLKYEPDYTQCDDSTS